MALNTKSYSFQSEPLPLTAIYALGELGNDTDTPVMQRMNGAEALIALASNAYLGYLLDRDMRQRDFEVFSRLAAQVPIRRIVRSANPVSIQDLCHAIIADVNPAATSASGKCI